PLETDAAQRLAERRVCLGERVAAQRKRVCQRLAHADLLRALTREDECDQWCAVAPPEAAAAAISWPTRSMNRPCAKRYAIATALRTALTLDRPRPTTGPPATPRSGAPPYAEESPRRR